MNSLEARLACVNDQSNSVEDDAKVTQHQGSKEQAKTSLELAARGWAAFESELVILVE